MKYIYQACVGAVNNHIEALLCEGVGIRGIARILKMAVGTVLSRVQVIANRIGKPVLTDKGRTFEVDELSTYIGRKDNEHWVAYALERETRQVVDFVVGRRTKGTLRDLIDRLLTSNPRVIRTDMLTLYQRLIPKNIHRCGANCINRIERKNLSLRTHSKRLGRRTICFSRSIKML